MKTQQAKNQFGQGSKIDAKNNQNKQSVSPSRNPNIGGDESEYETSDEDNFEEDNFEEDNFEKDNSAEDGVANRRDSEEVSKHDDQTRHSNSGWIVDADGNISV